MVKVDVAAVSEVADAVIVIDPARTALTVSVTTPPAAAAEPRPVTVPPPLALANVTTVVESPFARLPAPSRSSAVRVREEPEARFAVELVKTRRSAAPGPIVNVVDP